MPLEETKNSLLLDETKKNIEKDIGLTIEEMGGMDLCDITKYIVQKKNKDIEHNPRIYKRTRGSTYVARGRILTEKVHEERIERLIHKYL